jgi:hypothetical protein
VNEEKRDDAPRAGVAAAPGAGRPLSAPPSSSRRETRPEKVAGEPARVRAPRALLAGGASSARRAPYRRCLALHHRLVKHRLLQLRPNAI